MQTSSSNGVYGMQGPEEMKAHVQQLRKVKEFKISAADIFNSKIVSASLQAHLEIVYRSFFLMTVLTGAVCKTCSSS